MNYDLTTDILQSADDFYEAYKRCREVTNERHQGSKTINIPAIVNGAFACELYTKYLANSKLTGHNLKILFAELDEKYQKEILDESTSNKLQQIAVRYGYDSFDTSFEEMGSIFTEWRYIFEKDCPEGFYGNRMNMYLETLEILLMRLSAVSHNKEMSILN